MGIVNLQCSCCGNRRSVVYTAFNVARVIKEGWYRLIVYILKEKINFLMLDLLIMMIIWCLILVMLEKQYFIHVKKRKKR